MRIGKRIAAYILLIALFMTAIPGMTVDVLATENVQVVDVEGAANTVELTDSAPENDEPMETAEEVSENAKVLATSKADIKNPRIVSDNSMEAGQKVTYDCIYFGFYPQIELVLADSSEAKALEKMNADYVTEYEELNSEEFDKLASAKYNSMGDATVNIGTGDIKVRRIKKDNAICTFSSSGYYNWTNSTSYHYFRYDPIKWRVLSVDEDGNALVRADKGLDHQEYNTSNTSVTWETSTIRSWLNTADNGFLNTAFTDEEKAVINTTTVENKNNLYYGTSGGNNTEDKIFLLSESEVYSTDTAAYYGFVKSSSTYDEARRVQSSTYAYAMGAYRSISSSYAGNSYWWLRSPGIDPDSAASVYDYGYVDCNGYSVIDYSRAVCPALNINLSSLLIVNAGTVDSDGTKYEEHEYTAIISRSEPTCAKEGYKKYKCIKCNQIITDKIEKTPHDWDVELTVDKMPTCVQEGMKSIHCKKCQATKDSERIVKTEHQYGDWYIEPLNGGDVEFYRTRKCYNCNNVERKKEQLEELFPSGHGVILLNDTYTYTGRNLCPEVAVCYNNQILEPNVDYDLQYKNNINVSTADKPAKCIIKYKGDYKAVKAEEKNFYIEQANIEDGIVYCANLYNYEKTGVYRSEPFVILDDKILDSKEYTVSYWYDDECSKPMNAKNMYYIKEDSEVGESIFVFVQGKNKNICGSVICSYEVYKPQEQYLKNGCYIDINDGNEIVYNGKKQSPSVNISLDGIGDLVEYRDYTVKFSNNVIASDRAKCTIKFKGDYKRFKNETYTFSIRPLDLSEAEIYAEDNIKYVKPGVYKTKVSVYYNFNVLKSSDYTLEFYNDDFTLMNSKNKFEIDVDEAYKYANVCVKGKNNTSGENWIEYKVKVKPDSSKQTSRDGLWDISKARITVKEDQCYYHGYPCEPDVDVEVNILGTIYADLLNRRWAGLTTSNYDVTYVNNNKVGTATVIITGKNNAKGKKSISFKIK